MVKKTTWILIVEDEKELREALAAKLNEFGYKSISCGSASEAIKLCANQKFNGIIFDYQLDGGTGDLLAMQIRKNLSGLNRDTPLLLISGRLDILTLKALQTHISGALVKPFSPEIFVAKVQSLCPLLDPSSISGGVDGA